MYRVLHISDLHYDSEEQTNGKVDKKVDINISSSQEIEFIDLLEKYLSKENNIDLFVISGDIINGWDRDAQKKFSEKFIDLINKKGHSEKKVIVVPGNHDVKKGSPISSEERYEEFFSAWNSCNLPYLDKVHLSSDIICDEEKLLMFIPVNTSNWSQVRIKTNDKIQKHLESLDDSDLKKEFERQFTYDAAHISKEQIDFLRKRIQKIDNQENYIKILIQHHHLTSVDDSIEVKELSDILNIEELKEFIKDFNIRMLLHGHKHVGKTFYEYLNKDSKAYKLLISSASNLNKNNFFKILEFEDLEVNIFQYNRQNVIVDDGKFILFDDIQTENTIVIEDNDITKLHTKLCTLTKNNLSNNKQVICHLDLTHKYSSKEKKPIRYVKDKSIQKDFEDSVDRYKELWLSDDSIYKNDMPLHGIRYYNHSGFINQEETIKNEIDNEENTSRAIAILIEPTKDFHKVKIGDYYSKTDYPSFISCQFIVREEKYLDIIANFRTQEMKYWWTLNINELFELLCRMQSKLDKEYKLGKITTITNKPKQAENKAFGRLHVSRIDYYADRKRTELANLAHSLMCKNSFYSLRESNQSHFVNEWEKIFSDLFEFTKIEKNSDGNSKLRNGIKILYEHIEKASDSSCSNHRKFLNAIEILIDKIDLIDTSDSTNYRKRMDSFEEGLKNTETIFKKILEELKVNETETN